MIGKDLVTAKQRLKNPINWKELALCTMEFLLMVMIFLIVGVLYE